MPGCAPASSEAICAASSWNSNAPERNSGEADSAALPSPGGMRMPRGD